MDDICETCKHWTRIPNTDMGSCDGIWAYIQRGYGPIQIVPRSEHENVNAETFNAFGCNQHRMKQSTGPFKYWVGPDGSYYGIAYKHHPLPGGRWRLTVPTITDAMCVTDYLNTIWRNNG